MRKITSDAGKRQTLSGMFHRYLYESDVYPSLSRIPLYVRMKLDLTGIKISLKLWLQFSIQERTVLCHLPVETEEEKRAFSAYVDFLSRRYSDASVATTVALSSSLWDTSNHVPAAVLDRSSGSGRAISLEEWTRWQSHQRYALYKTAVSKSDPQQFFDVLKELRELKR
jgi:hypothetical protein